ncbi:MAG: helix-hairpin-helix domain-containing protein [Lewinellaceae bacterium]|nr:helix-hairpin-helix domain-containing protein [Lewinellaceae bacterium]
MLYKFSWDQVVTLDFLAEIKVISGSSDANELELSSFLSTLFKHVGGLPIARSNWDAQHRSFICKKLLHESISRLLKYRFTLPNSFSGVLADKNGIYREHKIVDINHDSERTLEDLPTIGPVTAKRIIETRADSGYFTSLEDLIDKIKGLGKKKGEELAGIFKFHTSGRPLIPAITGEFEKDLITALTLSGIQQDSDSLLSLIQDLTIFTANEPHPSVMFGIKRPDLEPDDDRIQQFDLVADRAELLEDQTYYEALIPVLYNANKSIDICMFFMATGNEEHPTQKLLDILVDKINQGIPIRVLLDKDRKEDPYGSRFVNSRAAKYLSDNGVEVRTDQTETLLHSKFVLVDEHILVIGSHNWTQGSYFYYKDISILLQGVTVNDAWKTRFESLWMNGNPF